MNTRILPFKQREQAERGERRERVETIVVPLPLPKLNAKERCKRDLHKFTLTQLNTCKAIAIRHRDFQMIALIERAIEQRCNVIEKNIFKAREATAIVYSNLKNNLN